MSTVREIAEKFRLFIFSEGLTREDIGQIRQLSAHALASTEPLGDERLRQLCHGEWMTSGQGKELIAEIRRLQAENEDLRTANAPLYSDRIKNLENTIADLRAQLQAAQCGIKELEPRAAFGDQCYQDRCESAYVEQSVVKRLQHIADGWGREVERLRAALRPFADAFLNRSMSGNEIIIHIKEGVQYCREANDVLATPAATPRCTCVVSKGETGTYSENTSKCILHAATATPPRPAEYRCTTCNGLAEWVQVEAVWRHADSGIAEHTFCPRYGYSIQVRQASGDIQPLALGTPAQPDDWGLGIDLRAKPTGDYELPAKADHIADINKMVQPPAQPIPFCEVHGAVDGSHRCNSFDNMPWQSSPAPAQEHPDTARLNWLGEHINYEFDNDERQGLLCEIDGYLRGSRDIRWAIDAARTAPEAQK